jgi:hypothetical protein
VWVTKSEYGPLEYALGASGRVVSEHGAIIGPVTKVPQPLPTTNEPQPTEGGQGEKKWKRPSEHLVLWLTIMAIGFVALRILIVARGDSDTIRALVQNLNVTAIVLATISPLVTTTVWLVFVVLLLTAANNAREANVQGKARKRLNSIAVVLATALLFGPPTVAICWFAMPMKYAIFAGILGVLLVIAYLGSWHGQQFRTVFQATGVLLFIVILVAGLYILIAQVGVWLPRERLLLGWWRTSIVYVLSSDEIWTKYLDDATHKVRVVPTRSVKQRETISSDDHWTNLTLSEIFG